MPVSHGFNVDEGIPAMGRFSVRFKPDTPPDVRANAFGTHADDAYGWARDTIVITPTRIQDPGLTRSTLLSKAVFSGMIEDVELGRMSEPWSVMGPSIMAWLGNGSSPKIGPINFGPYTINNDFATIMVALFSTAGNVNGLTVYSSSTCSANTISDDTVSGEVALDTIQRYMRQTTTRSEMWVRPDGGCHFAAQGNAAIFKQTPDVLFTSVGSDAGHQGGVYVIPGVEFRKTRSFREHATVINIENPGTWSGTGAWVPTPTRYGFDGTTAWYPETYYQSSAPASMNEETTLMYDRHRATTGHFQIDATVTTPCILSQLIPGDHVYLYDPDTYTFDTGNELNVGGGLQYPVKLRVAQVDMPIAPEMGVYRLANCSADPSANAVQDLSDWVIFEQGPTRVSFDTAGWSLKRLFHDFPQANAQNSSWR